MKTLWLLRHGETPWTVLGRHTGRTDIELTERGRRQAALLGRSLGGRPYALVLTSPLARAHETRRLAGYGETAVLEPDLQEWDYGAYEGRTTEQIRAERPGWTIWEDGVTGGEAIEEVAARADRVVARASSAGGGFALDTTSVSVLGSDRERRVIRHWNEVCHLDEAP